MEFFTYRLPNGIRGIHRQVKGSVAHCALVIGAGSRDEHPDQYGLAHFTEHAFLHQFDQILLRSANHPHIDMHLMVFANPTESAIIKETQ